MMSELRVLAHISKIERPGSVFDIVSTRAEGSRRIAADLAADFGEASIFLLSSSQQDHVG